MKKHILIIPDIHGRFFWKEPCMEVLKNKLCDLIIFLGDYLDPYIHQNISEDTALSNFKEIIELKKNNMDIITLLYGNHDIHYFDFFKDVYKVRFCKSIAKEAKQLFDDNKELFKIAEEIKLKNKRILFTHAGITSNWIKVIKNEIPCRPWRSRKLSDYMPECIMDIKPTADDLNNLLNTEEGLINLWMVSESRGGIFNYGSPIWAHITEHIESEPIKDIYQIFGHTISFPKEFEPWITLDYAMLDAQQCFVLEYSINNFKIMKYTEYKNNLINHDLG